MPWICSKCGQVNSVYANKCGRCEVPSAAVLDDPPAILEGSADELAYGFYWYEQVEKGFQIIRLGELGVEVIGEDRVYDSRDIKGKFWKIKKA